MNATSIAIHATLLGVSGVLAFSTWTKEEDADGGKFAQADVWSGTPAKLERVGFESKEGTLSLEPRRDKLGAYYVGTVVKTEAGVAEQVKHSHKEEKHLFDKDGGVGRGEHGHHDDDDAPIAKASEPVSFIAVGEGEELAKKLAPLRALRALGVLDEAKLDEFGLEETEGTLRVKIGGAEHTLLFGGKTPGGTDRYAKDAETGKAYVVEGSILRDLQNASQRLVERKLHDWEDSSVEKVVVHVGDQRRTLVRTAGERSFWSGEGSADTKDETASNWMSKLERLRVTSYEGEQLSPPPAASDRVVHVDYFDERRKIGFIDLYRRGAGTEGGKVEFVAQTEHTRWYAQVLRSTAEQVDQDVASVVAQ